MSEVPYTNWVKCPACESGYITVNSYTDSDGITETLEIICYDCNNKNKASP